ncbi:TetR/AcrR family transcriptional regulator [Agathobaculum desmolans]|uniref:TetR/AcrR family transcriptional regulator n=1 Tax=Agathobaculum desmolans TaxID=39484 RepID=UPI00248D725F|nr:TetR/AcrR family transcriptional regulator [Agathobaculum desmolans]
MAVQEDKRIRRTKKLLRQALTRLMQQKAFQSITVTDVVREADINRGTFYAHYRDVYDLREQIETEMIQDFRAMIADLRPSETATLQPVLRRAMDYLEENREIVVELVKVGGGKGFGKKMIGVTEEYRLENMPLRNVEDVYVARFVATGVVGMLEKWITEPQPLPKTEMIVLMAKVLAPIIAPAAGQ